jgi:hypothetical protein
MEDKEERNREPEGETTFRFPILDLMSNVNMKNIPPSVLPNFRGMVTEDPDDFLFEFDILCRSYNYVDDAQKLKLFPTTLKDSALRWFMGLEDYSIRSWEDMKSTFLKNIKTTVGLETPAMTSLRCNNQRKRVLKTTWKGFFTTSRKPSRVL